MYIFPFLTNASKKFQTSKLALYSWFIEQTLIWTVQITRYRRLVGPMSITLNQNTSKYKKMKKKKGEKIIIPTISKLNLIYNS